ncbi:uncharacterized protein [Amphiura filiformis]|uniref:uncharacterized protein n=1 Tax=Amphiura filiformis TaxID=82378 RepID=UPI003B216E57
MHRDIAAIICYGTSTCRTNLDQLVTEPTRHKDDCNNILDLVFTDNTNIVKKVSVTDGISDHDAVVVDLDLRPSRKRKKKKKKFLVDKADLEAIGDHIRQFSAEYFAKLVDVSASAKWDAIKNCILEAMEKFVPSRMTSSRFDVPWFSRALRRQCRKKQKLYNRARKTKSGEDWSIFCSARKEFTRAIRSAKARFVNEFLSSSIKDKPKAFWSYIKNLRQERTGVGDLKKDNKTVSDTKEKAEMLNHQFQSVFTKENDNTLPHVSFSLPHGIPNLIISTNGVEKLLMNINASKAMGPDGIPPWFLKLAAKILLHYYETCSRLRLIMEKCPMIGR